MLPSSLLERRERKGRGGGRRGGGTGGGREGKKEGMFPLVLPARDPSPPPLLASPSLPSTTSASLPTRPVLGAGQHVPTREEDGDGFFLQEGKGGKRKKERGKEGERD